MARNGLWAEMALAAYNLVRIAKLMPSAIISGAVSACCGCNALTGGASGPIWGDPARRLLRIGVQQHLNTDTGRSLYPKLACFIRLLLLQRRFKEGCAGRHEVRRGAWHGSAWPVRYYPASLPATAATQPARTVPWAAIPAPPGRPAAS